MEGVSDQMSRDTSCLLCDLYHDVDNPNMVYLFGLWNDLAAFQNLMDSKLGTIFRGLEILLDKPVETHLMVPHSLYQEQENSQYRLDGH